ncbi:MAG: hypothetical protein RR651_13380 [Lysinibacillus sp.]
MINKEEFNAARDELYSLFIKKIEKTFDLEDSNIHYRTFHEASITLFRNGSELYVEFGDDSVAILFDPTKEPKEVRKAIILGFEDGKWLVREDSDWDKSVFDDKNLDRVLRHFNFISDKGRTE